MNGNDTNDITFILYGMQSKSYNFLWQMRNTNMGNQWNYGSFGFYYDAPYEIMIKGLRGSAGGSEDTITAIDDIFFKESTYCTVSPPQARKSALPPLTLGTNSSQLSNVTSRFDCDFETSLGKWTVDESASRKWMRTSGRLTHSPEVDHT